MSIAVGRRVRVLKCPGDPLFEGRSGYVDFPLLFWLGKPHLEGRVAVKLDTGGTLVLDTHDGDELEVFV